MTPPSKEALLQAKDKLLGAWRSLHHALTGGNPKEIQEAEAWAKQVEEEFAHHQAIVEIEGKISVWTRIKKREGLYVNADGCVEIHMDYVDECIEELEQQKAAMMKGHNDGAS